MNKRRFHSLMVAIASAVLLSACASSPPHSTLPNSGLAVTINLDKDSFNLSSLNQMPTPETLKFTLDWESKTHLTRQAARTKDDLVTLWPAQSHHSEMALFCSIWRLRISRP